MQLRLWGTGRSGSTPDLDSYKIHRKICHHCSTSLVCAHPQFCILYDVRGKTCPQTVTANVQWNISKYGNFSKAFNDYTGYAQPVVAPLNPEHQARKSQLLLLKCSVWPGPGLILPLPLSKPTILQLYYIGHSSIFVFTQINQPVEWTILDNCWSHIANKTINGRILF